MSESTVIIPRKGSTTLNTIHKISRGDYSQIFHYSLLHLLLFRLFPGHYTHVYEMILPHLLWAILCRIVTIYSTSWRSIYFTKPRMHQCPSQISTVLFFYPALSPLWSLTAGKHQSAVSLRSPRDLSITSEYFCIMLLARNQTCYHWIHLPLSAIIDFISVSC